jgi:hypothetical protein
MNSKLLHLLSTSALIALVTIAAGCNHLPVTATPTSLSTLFPTSTPNLALAQQAAALYEQNFEESPLKGLSENGSWSVSLDEAGNHVFCNQISNNWQTFMFGYENWTDYAVEMRVKLLKQNTDLSAEIYARINDSTYGYRGQLYNMRAGLAYILPLEILGIVSITTEPNHWYILRIEVAGNQIKFYLDNQVIASASDSNRSNGMGGFGVAPGAEACVDDIRAWALTPDGQIAQAAPADQIVSNDSLAKYEGDCTFCFVDGSDPSMPVWDQAAGGYKQQPGDTRKQTVRDENFVVPAKQVTTFENQIVFVRPHQRHDIKVYGTLIIKNSLLLWQQTENQQTYLLIEKGGKLVIENSYAFSSNPFWVGWTFEDGSTVSFDHFVGTPWCSIWGSVNYTATNFSTVELTLFGDVHNTRVEVSNAHHVEFEFFPPPGTYEFSLPKKEQWVDWKIDNIWPNTTIDMTHSYFYARSISLDSNVHVTITNTVDGISVGWAIHKDTPGFVDCEIKGLGEPGNDQGVLYQNTTWDLPCINSSLTIKNSVLQTAWPCSYGYVHLKVYDSNLFDPRNWGPPSTYEIYRSSIHFVAAYNGGLIYLENSKVQSGIEINGAGSIVYGYGVSATNPGSNYSIMQESGGKYVELQSAGPPWK